MSEEYTALKIDQDKIIKRMKEELVIYETNKDILE